MWNCVGVFIDISRIANVKKNPATEKQTFVRISNGNAIIVAPAPLKPFHTHHEAVANQSHPDQKDFPGTF